MIHDASKVEECNDELVAQLTDAKQKAESK